MRRQKRLQDYQKQNRRKVPSIAQNITEPTIDRREPSRTWDAAEDEELKREFGFGMKIAEIARQHDRTYGAIRARLKSRDDRITPVNFT